MNLSQADLAAIFLTLKLSVVTTLCLLLICIPLAFWLSKNQSWLQRIVNAIVTLPLILPPTVIGFYLLLFLSPNSATGNFLQSIGFAVLPFTFEGLVLASCVYSLPFVVQPICHAMSSIDKRTLELSATMGAGPLDRFFTVVMPLAKPGIITGAILGFAHTVGEFGIVLMIGGNIPGETQVVSLLIYEHVESLNYTQANKLALILVAFSFVVVMATQWLGGAQVRGVLARGR